MAQLAGFEWDVFISYAHADNSTGWVTALDREITTRLSVLLARPARVWRDPLDGNQRIDATLKARVQPAATLVAVVTPSQAKSVYCRQELQWFVDANGKDSTTTTSRIFAVRKTPLFQVAEPDLLKAENTPGFLFHDLDERTKNFREYAHATHGYEHRKFDEQCDLLAQSLARQILSMENAAGSQGSSRKVLVAYTATELEPARGRFLSELTAHGHVVGPPGASPRSVQELEQLLEPWLSEATVAVHALGSVYGQVPEGEPEKSIAHLQLLRAMEQASQRSLRQIIWIAEGGPEPEPRMKALLKFLYEHDHGRLQPELIRCREEQFKIELRDLLSKRPPPIPPGSSKAKSVVVLCRREDLSASPLKQIRAYFHGRGYPADPPAFEGEPGELREYDERLIGEADGTLIYYGGAQDVWVHERRKFVLRALAKANRGPQHTRGLYLCQPPSEVKMGVFADFMGGTIPEGNGFPPLLILGDCGQFLPEKLKPFVDQLERGSGS